MDYLLDTQIMIWILTDPNKLPGNIVRIIEEPDNSICVSSVSLFEVVIKQTIQKLPEFSATTLEIVEQLSRISILVKPIIDSHIANYSKVPFLEEHSDPFDRLILSVANIESLPVISSDAKFKLYPDFVNVVWRTK